MNDMKELKRMLKVIHEENKRILSLLCSDNIKTIEEYFQISDEVDKMYDELFYGKEIDENEKFEN